LAQKPDSAARPAGFLNAAGASIACSYNWSFRGEVEILFLINQNIIQEYRRRDKPHMPAGSNSSQEQAELM
jgi:hypothetical protein